MTRLRAVKLYQDEKRKVIAIESVELSQSKFNSGGQVYGSITPLAVVVCGSDGNEVLVLDADDVELDKMKQLHPGLDELIVNACRMLPNQA